VLNKIIKLVSHIKFFADLLSLLHTCLPQRI